MKCIAMVAALLSPAIAMAGTPPLIVDGYSARIDPVAQQATFEIDYLVPPDYARANAQGLPKDSFALWIDPDSAYAYDRAQSHYRGDLPGSRQTFLTADAVPQSGALQASAVVDSTTYTGDYGIDGWGSPAGSFAYVQSHGVVTFALPLSLLGVTTGPFYYSFLFTRYGATEGGPFEGVSGIAYTPPFPTMPGPVPEPPTGLLAAAGLLALTALRARRRVATCRP
ncbi:MAG: hypothetical protein JSR59_16545 [Proteobacteria bacterium]|nr:hypothetical protein [Pseudomonadota bacterium]